MTTDLLAPTNKDTEPKRDRYGRYLILPPTGNKPIAYTRATTIAKTLDDTYNLEQWKLRTAAKGIASRPDLIARIATTTPDDKTTLNNLCADALTAGQADSGANLGTALHTATEHHDRGQALDQLPDTMKADIDAYAAAMRAHGIVTYPHWIEKTVVDDTNKIAGTFDRIVQLPTGELVIADLKTGQDLSWSWPGIAVQLAIYANANAIYNHATHTRTELPADLDKTIGLVIHLPAGKARCTLHTIDLIEGHRALGLSLQTRAWRSHKHLAHEYRPTLEDDATHHRAPLIARLAQIKKENPAALRDLASRWPAHIATFKQTDVHTVAECVEIDALISEIETLYSISF